MYLQDKFKVQKAFIFIGYLPGNEDLYTTLQKFGYILVFKPTLELSDGTVKGNVDAELVLHTMIEYGNYDQAVVVSGDGDFHCLIEHLVKENKLKKMLIPNKNKYSSLLKKFYPKLVFLNHPDLKKKI
ncbi:MAG: NYN domain-containing protein [Candidatus Peribacteria bacterium]|nr:MAG: NYN domain-containing protein [Candidatus Peribacteria bacterium]